MLPTSRKTFLGVKSGKTFRDLEETFPDVEKTFLGIKTPPDVQKIPTISLEPTFLDIQETFRDLEYGSFLDVGKTFPDVGETFLVIGGPLDVQKSPTTSKQLFSMFRKPPAISRRLFWMSGRLFLMS